MFDLSKILPLMLNLLSGSFGSGGKGSNNFNSPPDYDRDYNPRQSAPIFGSGGSAGSPPPQNSSCGYNQSTYNNAQKNSAGCWGGANSHNSAAPGSKGSVHSSNGSQPDFSNAYWNLPTYDIPESQAPPFESQTATPQPEPKPMFDINLIIQLANQLASMFASGVSTQKQDSATKKPEKDEKKEGFSFISKYPRTDQFIFS